MSNRVVHFEIPCDHPEKVITFFKTAFGWNFQQFGEEKYWLASTGDEKEPGINGAIMQKNPGQPMVNSISVADLDTAIKNVEAAGGKIVVPKNTIPGVGYMAYFTDPDGNIHGLWHEDKYAK